MQHLGSVARNLVYFGIEVAQYLADMPLAGIVALRIILEK